MSKKNTQLRIEQGLPLQTAGGICDANTFSKNIYCATGKDKYFPCTTQPKITSSCPKSWHNWMVRQK